MNSFEISSALATTQAELIPGWKLTPYCLHNEFAQNLSQSASNLSLTSVTEYLDLLYTLSSQAPRDIQEAQLNDYYTNLVASSNCNPELEFSTSMDRQVLTAVAPADTDTFACSDAELRWEFCKMTDTLLTIEGLGSYKAFGKPLLFNTDNPLFFSNAIINSGQILYASESTQTLLDDWLVQGRRTATLEEFNEAWQETQATEGRSIAFYYCRPLLAHIVDNVAARLTIPSSDDILTANKLRKQFRNDPRTALSQFRTRRPSLAGKVNLSMHYGKGPR